MIGRLALLLLFIVLRDLLPGQSVKFQCTDDPLHIVFMNGFCRFWIDLTQFLMKPGASLFLCQCFQLRPIGTCFIFRKINIPHHCLNIESGSSHQNRNVPTASNLLHGSTRHLLKAHHMKFFKRLQLIHQIMTDSVHLLWHNLCRTYIHIFVDLHGIRRNDLSPNCFCKSNG